MTIYDELKARGLIAQVTDEEEIKELINNGKATFYIGFDCTADSLTAGHFMALTLMKRLQQAGNRPIALIGGGTTMIGDPSGRTDMRKMLTKEDIDHNADDRVDPLVREEAALRRAVQQDAERDADDISEQRGHDRDIERIPSALQKHLRELFSCHPYTPPRRMQARCAAYNPARAPVRFHRRGAAAPSARTPCRRATWCWRRRC